MRSHAAAMIGAATISIGLFLTGAAVAQQPACEPDKIAQKYPGLAGRTIKIGVDPQTPPYVMRDAADFTKVIGVDADLARAVFTCAGVKHEFFLGGWSGLLPAVMSGQIDVMWDNLYYKPERAKSVDLILYMKAGTGALVPAGNPQNITKKDDLCGRTVSYGVGSVEDVTMKEQDKICRAGGLPGVNVMPFQDLASGLRLLDNSRTDALLWDLGFVDATASSNPKKYARGFATYSGLIIAAAVKKGDSDLAAAIHDGLAVLQSKGEQKAIFQKYGVDPGLEVGTQVKTN